MLTFDFEAIESYQDFPDQHGHFGPFGGCFIAETLMQPLAQLQQAYATCRADKVFMRDLYQDLQHYVGRPTPLYFAKRLTESLGGAQIYLKREDLAHTGAHKINNTMGQLLLAQRLGKTRIIAETGAGQHGVATATVAARLGLQCVVYMGAEDMSRQAPNVERMKLLGADVIPVTSGAKTLKDAVNDALRDWVANVDNSFYCLGSVAGPHPYPQMVRDFQAIIGQEVRQQLQQQTGRLPDVVLACVGGGSNAIGLFHPFLDDKQVRIIGVEAAGKGLRTGQHASAILGGRIGVFQGNRSYVMCDDDGQITLPHSISAGLDYPAIGPEHAFLYQSKRAEYVGISDQQALQAFHQLAKLEGILPALETSHAIAYLNQLAPSLTKDKIIVVNLSGRGDKDLQTIMRYNSNQ